MNTVSFMHKSVGVSEEFATPYIIAYFAVKIKVIL